MRRAQRRRQRRDGGTIGDVDDIAAGANARRLGLCRRRGKARAVDVDEREIAAAARQRQGDAATDAAGCAGDDGDAAAQFHGIVPARPNRSTPSSMRPKRSASMSMK